MKNMTTRSLFLITLLLLVVVVNPAASWANEKVAIAMVLWRGITDAEKGFQAQLALSKRYDFEHTIFNANQDKKELDRIIDELDTSQYRLIYSFGTTVTKALKARFTDIPIVFNIVSRPVKAKIIDSWDHSGSNLTGASNAVPMSSAFNTLSKVMHIGRLGFLYNPVEANSKIQRDEVEKLQTLYGYEMVDAPVKRTEDIKPAVEKLVQAKVDAVLLPSDSFVKSHASDIIPILNQQKLPSIVSIPGMVRDNEAFLGLGPNYFELGQLAAGKVLAILGGFEPNKIPSSRLKRLHMTVNLKTAMSIGIKVPVQIIRVSTVIK